MVFKTRGITFKFYVVYFGKKNHFHFLGGVLDNRNYFHFIGGVFWEKKSLSLSGLCFDQE